MSHQPSPRGGATVGVLSELPPLEAGAVVYLRCWFDGPESRNQLRRDFYDLLGVDYANAALDKFAQLCQLCAQHGRRPLVRHGLSCTCLGADENCFANFIACATEGEREDAMLLATLLVRPDMAPSLMGLATQFGLALKQMTANLSSELQSRPSSATLH